MYVFSSREFDINEVQIALSFALLSFAYLIFIRYKAGISRNSISITLLFPLGYCIVFFQTPLDLALSSFSDNTLYTTYIYDESILVKSIWYAVAFFILVCIGMHYQSIKLVKHRNRYSVKRNYIAQKPFFILFYLFTILHLLTTDLSYYLGNRNLSPEGFAGSIHGYMTLLIPVCFGVLTYNYKIRHNNSNLSIISYLRLFPLPFIIILTLFSVLSFLAADRGPAIKTLLALLGGYYIISNKNISYFRFFLLIILSGIFLSTIKLVGAININDDVFNSLIEAYKRLGENERSESISPYTAELAASFRAYNIGFSLWSNGYSNYGLVLVTGFLMSIPYAVTTFQKAFDIDGVDINSASLVTSYVREDYGLGTALVSDSLITIGFLPTLCIAFLLGRLLLKLDYHFFIKPDNVYYYAVGYYFLTNSIYFSRYTIYPAIGNSLFIILVIYIISSASYKKLK
ncbi:hypothetical protein ACTXLD_09085 [Psychrobacter faecalis]